MAEAGQRWNDRRRRLLGRDPDEAHRTVTPLELLWRDPTFSGGNRTKWAP